jgi:hypothetical protein
MLLVRNGKGLGRSGCAQQPAGDIAKEKGKRTVRSARNIEDLTDSPEELCKAERVLIRGNTADGHAFIAYNR